MQIIHSRIGEIIDPDILQLLDELRTTTCACIPDYQELSVLDFLQICFHPGGGNSKPIKVTMEMIDGFDPADSFLLRKKIGKTEDGLHRLLADLAHLLKNSVESYSGTSVFMLLNKACPMPRPKKKVRFS